MTFSELAKILHTFLGRDIQPSDFVVALVDNILVDPLNAEEQEKQENADFNPLLSLSPSTCKSYFNGTRTFGKNTAAWILAHLDKVKFKEYLISFDISDDTITSLCYDIKTAGYPAVEPSNFGEICADIFESAMKSLISKPKTKDRNSIDFSFNYNGDNNTAGTLKPVVNVEGFFRLYVPAKEFINRDAPRQVFYDTLEGKSQRKVIMYCGIGGIGKSSLVANLKEYTKQKGVLFSFVDFDDPALRSPYKALIELEKVLNLSLPHFDFAVALCFLKRNPNYLSDDIALPGQISRELIKFYQQFRKASYIGSLNGFIHKAYGNASFASALSYDLQNELLSLEGAGANEIIEQLPDFFAFDLANYLANKNKPCVLFFDTYELLSRNRYGKIKKSLNDAWIKRLAEKLPDVIFVLSGRQNIDWETEDVFWEGKIQFVPIDLLSEEFAYQYLNVCKIVEPGIRENIVRASQGHPYYLDLCVDTYYKIKRANRDVTSLDFGKGYAEIQARFFRSLSDQEIRTLNVLSIPRFYDIAIFKYLIDTFKTGFSVMDIGEFNSLSFVKEDENEKFFIHFLMRNEIAKRIDKNLKREINGSMVDFYKNKLLGVELVIEDIKFYFSELLHHLNHTASSDDFLQHIEHNYIEIIKRLQFSGETRYLLERFREIFDEKITILGGTEFFSIMVDMIHLSGEYKAAVEIIDNYLSSMALQQIANDSYALGLYIRKAHHRMFYTPIKVLENDLLSIIDKVDITNNAPQYCELLFMLGAHIYLPLGEFDIAYDYLRKVNRIATLNQFHGLLCRGLRKTAELMCAKGEYSTAECVCKKGWEIATKNSLWRYEVYLRCVLGEIYRLMDKVDKAVAAFEEALPIAKSLGISGWVGHIHLALGNCYVDILSPEDAKEHYSIARETYEAIGQKWGAINLEVAYQRMRLCFDEDVNPGELNRLKEESIQLGYNVLAEGITGLLNGNRNQIRFEYL